MDLDGSQILLTKFNWDVHKLRNALGEEGLRFVTNLRNLYGFCVSKEEGGQNSRQNRVT
jgi:hypothetical protein